MKTKLPSIKRGKDRLKGKNLIKKKTKRTAVKEDFRKRKLK